MVSFGQLFQFEVTTRIVSEFFNDGNGVRDNPLNSTFPPGLCYRLFSFREVSRVDSTVIHGGEKPKIVCPGSGQAHDTNAGPENRTVELHV